MFEQENKKNRISNTTLIFQTILIVLFAISTVLSKNIGGSYYYFWNFIVVIFVVNLSNYYINSIETLKKYVIYLSILFSTTLILSKTGLISLPLKDIGDNFILQVWGHSYLGNFLLIPITIIISQINRQNFKIKLALLLLFCTALILSQSRSGIVGTIIAIVIFRSKDIFQNKIKTYLLFFISILFIGLISYSFSPKALNKSFDGARPGYWRQALVGIQQSPFFGNGPVTFSFINRQFKQIADPITNTAHNLIFEYLSNNGIIFTSVLLIYLFFGLKHQYRHNQLFFCIGTALLASSLLDSFYTNPGIFAIILFFVTHKFVDHTSKFSKLFISTISILLFIFFVSKTSSDFAYFNQKYQLSLILDPFNLNSRIKLFDSKSITQSLKIYSNDEVYLQSLIEHSTLPQNKNYYQHLLEINPYSNPIYYYQLGYYYFEQNDTDNLEKLLNKYNKNYPSDSKTITHSVQMAKLFYFQSIYEWNQHNYTKAIDLMKLSITHSGGWSHFHIELANMYWHQNQKQLARQELLENCQNFVVSPQCLDYLNQHQNSFTYPGDINFTNTIKLIKSP